MAVPFPYAERLQLKRRAAVVVSGRRWLETHGLLWVVMITSADNPPRPNDVAIDDLARAGLPRSSVIRPAKIATVEGVRCERRGELSCATARKVEAALQAGLGWSS